MKKILIFSIVLLGLGACQITGPDVSELEDSFKLETGGGTSGGSDQIQAPED